MSVCSDLTEKESDSDSEALSVPKSPPGVVLLLTVWEEERWHTPEPFP